MSSHFPLLSRGAAGLGTRAVAPRALPLRARGSGQGFPHPSASCALSRVVHRPCLCILALTAGACDGTEWVRDAMEGLRAAALAAPGDCCWGPVAQAQAPAPGEGSAAANAESSAQALAVYEQGKRLYDAKDYSGALAKFDEVAALEPGKARWQYNRGLALRKLDRFPEARDALLKSRNPGPGVQAGRDRRQAARDGVLPVLFLPGGVGCGQSGSTSSSPSRARGERTAARSLAGIICVAVPLLFIVGLVVLVRCIIRKAKARGEEEVPVKRFKGRSASASRAPPTAAGQLEGDAQRGRVAPGPADGAGGERADLGGTCAPAGGGRRPARPAQPGHDGGAAGA